MSERLFNAFLSKKSGVEYFSDEALNTAAAKHPNINAFCHKALSAPTSLQRSVGKTRIHQALQNAGWDIGKITAPTDLGVPAFNSGSKAFASEDFDNGLGVMINGIQYVYVLATHYHYDKDLCRYFLKLKFYFYDVFGLDDEDLTEFGAASDGLFSTSASVGITAWWQLQHQCNFAPLVTRISRISKDYWIPTK